jgi:hypothetical protein
MPSADEDNPGIPFPLPFSPDFASLFEAHAGLVSSLEDFDVATTAPYVAGLLTCPEWQASTFRLEMLQQFVVAVARGRRKPKPVNLKSWLTELGDGIAGRMEDPVEDVFVSRVILPDRDCMVFEGVYEASAFYLQRFMNLLQKMPLAEPFAGMRRAADSLLRLSHAAALRAGVQAHMVGETMPLQTVPNRLLRHLDDLKKRVMFPDEELASLGISIDDLDAFIFDPRTANEIQNEWLGHSTLERFPLLRIGDQICLAVPSAVSIAIRRMVIEFAVSTGQAETLYGAYAREVRDSFTGMGLMGGSPVPPLPFRKQGGFYFADVARMIDEGRFLHFCFVVDEFATYPDTGMAGAYPNPVSLSELIDKNITASYQSYSAKPGFRGGISVIVVCPWGRPVSFGFNGVEDRRWRVEMISAADLDSVSWIPEFSPELFWRILDSRDRLQEMNCEIMNMNGLLNLYAWSESMDGHLIPHGQIPDDHDSDVPFNILIPQDGLLAVRQAGAQSWNPHHARTWDGRNVRVRRETPKSFFKKDHALPLYVSMDDLDAGELLAVFETERRGWWTKVETPNSQDRDFHYRLWHLTIVWIARAAPVLEQALGSLPPGPIAWICRFEDRKTSDAPEHVPTRSEARALLETQLEGNVIKVTAKDDFLASFCNAANIGESLLVEALIGGALRLSGEEQTERVESLAEQIIPDEWARDMHFFQARRFRDFVQESMPRHPILIERMDDTYSKLGLGWRKRNRSEGPRIHGVEDCCAYLNRVIDGIWEETRAELQNLNRHRLLIQLVANHESIIRDTEQWQRTARAILSLQDHSEQATRASVERISEFNGGSLSTRILIEIALCECPEEGGTEAGTIDIARLMTKAMQMHYFGGWSEAIRYGSKKAEIRITPFGDIHTEAEFDDRIATPYGRALGAKKFQLGARGYEEHFKQPKIVTETESGFGLEFWRAWTEAFGFAIDELRVFMDNLENEGIRLRQFAFVASFEDLCRLESVGKLEEETIKRIVETFTLRPRPTWASAPEGFSDRDWYPWRFRRRLSVVSRPILQINSSGAHRYLVAPGIVRDGAIKVLEYCHRGGYDAKDFANGRMRSWIGAAENKRGHEFNITVSERLKELGWQTKPNVKLTEILNEKLNKDYGDIDVLAWRGGRVLAIECKDLELAMTTGEIARQLSDFRGETGAAGKPDRLKRHLARAEILKSRAESVRRYTRMTDTSDIQACLMFSDIVPMNFSEIAGRKDVTLAVLDDAENL